MLRTGAMRLLLLACAWVGAASLQLHFASVRRTGAAPAPLVTCGAMEGDEAVIDVVAQQRAEIAALRSKVEALEREQNARRVALGKGARRRPRGKARRPPSYKLYGEIPPNFDVAPVERLIARRAGAKAKENYSEADRLQRRILRMGIQLDDRRRTWSVLPTWQTMQDEVPPSTPFRPLHSPSLPFPSSSHRRRALSPGAARQARRAKWAAAADVTTAARGAHSHTLRLLGLR